MLNHRGLVRVDPQAVLQRRLGQRVFFVLFLQASDVVERGGAVQRIPLGVQVLAGDDVGPATQGKLVFAQPLI